MGQFHSIEASPENIPELVALLTSGRSSQKKKAAAALAALADDEANQVRIASLSGIPPLLALVRDGKRQRKTDAALALAKLSANGEIQEKIGAFGGIPAFVKLVQDGNDIQKRIAATALLHLAKNVDNRLKFVAAKGIAPLIALIRDGNPVQKEEAAGVLAALTTTRDNQAAVAATGGIFDLLVDLVRNGTFAERNHALTALKALSVRDKSKEVIAATGAIPVLRMLLLPMELTPSCDGVYPEKQHALSALLHLSAGSDEVKAKMAADGVIPALVRLVCSDGRMKQDAAFALENLSAYHDIFDIMSPYGIPPLVALLRVGTLSQKGNAVMALFNRAGYHDNRPVIVRAGVIPPLMELMQDDFGVLQEQVVQVLALLSEAPILRSGNPGEKEYAARALASLSLSDANKKDIASADDADVRAVIEYANENALEELFNFHAIDAHDSATTAELILSMVREGDSVQQIQGPLMLLVWSAAEKNVNSIVAAGGVSLVMKVLSHNNAIYREPAVKVLKLLSRNSNSHGEIAAAGAIPILVSLVCDGSNAETLNATVALANLASSAESQEVIASAGGIFPLLKLVSEGNDHQRENAALALANLSDNANRDAIVSAGIPAFVAMVRDGSVRHKINATLALRDLSTIDKGRLAIAQTVTLPDPPPAEENAPTPVTTTDSLRDILFFYEGDIGLVAVSPLTCGLQLRAEIAKQLKLKAEEVQLLVLQREDGSWANQDDAGKLPGREMRHVYLQTINAMLPDIGDEDMIHLRVEIAEEEPDSDTDDGNVNTVSEAIARFNSAFADMAEMSEPSKYDKNTATSIFEYKYVGTYTEEPAQLPKQYVEAIKFEYRKNVMSWKLPWDLADTERLCLSNLSKQWIELHKDVKLENCGLREVGKASYVILRGDRMVVVTEAKRCDMTGAKHENFAVMEAPRNEQYGTLKGICTDFQNWVFVSREKDNICSDSTSMILTNGFKLPENLLTIANKVYGMLVRL
ncbi:hypothetical protein JG688_00010936 [Phytophthora aleatoria]|uniref:Uncharacterized protein n=1 Tax=Phytophthora aleatoria TaxID=2496075 RepID=A0A8J5IDI4_9STRA|nr:hypothetical protein JG688_00010936 [Phytophthora aleatoria]